MKTDSQNSPGYEMDTHAGPTEADITCKALGLPDPWFNAFLKQISEEWLGNAWCKKIPPEGSAAWFVPWPPKITLSPSPPGVQSMVRADLK